MSPLRSHLQRSAEKAVTSSEEDQSGRRERVKCYLGGCIWICSDALDWTTMVLVPAWLVIRRMTHLCSLLIVLAVMAIRHADRVYLPLDWEFTVCHYSAIYAFFIEKSKWDWPHVKSEWPKLETQTKKHTVIIKHWASLPTLPLTLKAVLTNCRLNVPQDNTICFLNGSFKYPYISI